MHTFPVQRLGSDVVQPFWYFRKGGAGNYRVVDRVGENQILISTTKWVPERVLYP